jgi:hypothetical protein
MSVCSPSANMCPTIADILNQDAYGYPPFYDNLYRRLNPGSQANADCYVGCDAWANAVGCGATLAQFLNPDNGWFDTSGTSSPGCKPPCHRLGVLDVVDALDIITGPGYNYSWRDQPVGGQYITDVGGAGSLSLRSPLETNYCCTSSGVPSLACSNGHPHVDVPVLPLP